MLSVKQLGLSGYGSTCEEEMSLGGLLSLLQTRVEEAQELENTLLPARLCQTRIVHHQIWVDLSIMATDVETAGSCVVLLDDLHPGHESEKHSRIERVITARRITHRLGTLLL